MLIVETIGRIRRERLGKGKSIKEIWRTLHLSRNTVRRILRSGETAFSYEREVQPRPKLGPWTEALDRLLTANAEATTRERLTLIRIYEEWRPLGYAGGYDAVRRYTRRWGEQHASATAEAYIPLTFAPGEAYQFDWSHEIVVIGGVTTTVKVAHVRLCHSRMMFVRAYPRETQGMVFDAHDRAFAFFKGACTRGIYDNMKTAVDTVLVRARTTSTIAASSRCARIAWVAEAQFGLHAGRGLGEGPGRGPGRAGARALPHAAAEGPATTEVQCAGLELADPDPYQLPVQCRAAWTAGAASRPR